MSQPNMTGVVYSGDCKRRIGTLQSSSPVAILKSLESLGLIGSTTELQKMVTAGQMKLSALGEQRKFFEYEIDQAFHDIDAKPTDRLAFKINLERAGLMKPNPR